MLGAIGDRQVRSAENQLLFRDINQRVRDGTSPAAGLVIVDAWLCECASETCFAHVPLAPEEYDLVRADGTRFIVVPDEAHVSADFERLVSTHERYWVVEKVEDGGRVAEELLSF